MNSKPVNKFFALPFIIAGIIFIVVGVMLMNYYSNFNKTIKEVDATISNKLTISSEGKDTTNVFVDYEVDGKSYHSAYNNYKKDDDNNGVIKVYYLIDDPGVLIVKSKYEFIKYLFLALGVVVIIIGTIYSIKTNMKYKKYSSIKLTGVRIEAHIISIEVNNALIKDGKCPYYLICSYKDENTGEEHSYESKIVWFDLRKIILDNNIEMVPVYIDPNNKTNYLVDIDSLNIYDK